MDLEIIKAALILHFLFWQQVDSVISSLSKYPISSKNESDNVLDDFINRFKMDYLEKRVPRHITLVGASAEDLRNVETLFESYPCIICTEPKACFYRFWFSRGSFVIIFLDDLREETFIKNDNILSHCRICKILYIFRGIIVNNYSIRSLFNLTMQKYGINAQFAHLEKNVTKFYGSIIAKNCSIEVRSITVWTPGTTLNVIDSWTSGSHDLNGCIVTLSTLNFAPKMIVNEYENGSLMITGGLEGELILALAKKFNFTLKLRYPSMPERLKYSRKSAIVLDVDNGDAEIGIGRLRPYTNDMYEKIGYSIAYDHDCVTWGVPLVMIWADNVIWFEFTSQVWTLIGLVFMIICMIGSACHNIDSSINGKQKNMGFAGVVLDVIAIHLGNPLADVPTSVSGKFMLIMGLYYALVVTTAYKTSLASILTTDNGLPAIIDIKGIINANLSIGGGNYNLDFLKDQANEYDTISKLIDRFVVINDPSEVMRRLQFDSNFACLSRRSALVHERNRIAKTQKPISFIIFRDCVLYHETVIVFRKVSTLRDPANDMIRRLSESGILDHWDSLAVFDPESMKKRESNVAKSSTMKKFKNIFFLYIVCIAFSFIIFLIELGIAMQDSRNKKTSPN